MQAMNEVPKSESETAETAVANDWTLEIEARPGAADPFAFVEAIRAVERSVY